MVERHNFIPMSKYEPSRRIKAISKLYGKGKTSVPSEVRKSLGAKDGDKILWIKEEGKWVVELA